MGHLCCPLATVSLGHRSYTPTGKKSQHSCKSQPGCAVSAGADDAKRTKQHLWASPRCGKGFSTLNV